MSRKPRKSAREKDLTSRYFSGNLDEDRVDSHQRFTQRSADAEQNKILRTTARRAANEITSADVEGLPIGEVIQVHSQFCDVLLDGVVHLCIIRKTLTKVSDTSVIVGDRVRIRADGSVHETGRPEAVIEQILPRRTVLTRADSFKQQLQHPIVANADQMLIVASIAHPYVKWGLIDRMLIAAQSGGLKAIICLNKIDLVEADPVAQKHMPFASEALEQYAKIGIPAVRASANSGQGLDELRTILKDRVTVLTGHSGVGKSSLLGAVQAGLDLRVGAISKYTGKGRHTTSSARRYPLNEGGAVVDTPGVKMLGLWNVTPERLKDFFPDIEDGSAPKWRRDSYERILEGL
jgi:ribosome biogenesis GTPase